MITINFNKLNFAKRSFIKINDLFLPIIVNINNIYDNETEIDNYIVNFITNKNNEFKYEIDLTNSPFQKQIEAYDFMNKIKFIYKYIDIDIIDYNGTNIGEAYNKLLNYDISKFDNFYKYIVNTDNITEDDITKAIFQIQFLIVKCKNIFIERAKEYLDFDRVFPNISLKHGNSVYMNKYNKTMLYPMGMIELQTVSEYPMDIWFEENKNKAFSEWSWREKQLKKMYITMKVKIENFRELVKAKDIEELNNKK